MEIYVLRHGIATERDPVRSGQDARRSLTQKGAKKIARIARKMRNLTDSLDVTISSPFARARETAEIVAGEFGCRVHVSLHLKPGGDRAALIREINTRFQKTESVLLVGHEPYLSKLISVLLGGDESIAVTMKKGGLCKLSAEYLRNGRCAKLEWLLGPAQILPR